MELQAAIKVLRKELALTQSELAKEIHVTFATVNRWETGKTIPDTTATEELLALCKRKVVSTNCYKAVKKALKDCRKETMHLPNSELYAVEKESICQLVDDSVYGCYVSDLENYELLYVNHQAELFFNKEFRAEDNQKCYEFFAERTTPCEQCPKCLLSDVGCSEIHVISPKKDKYFHVRGKKVIWNGRKAHAQLLQDETDDWAAQNKIWHLLNKVNIGIFTAFIYEDGRVEIPYINDGYYSMIGAHRDSDRRLRVSSELFDIHPDDVEPLRGQIEEAYRTGKDFQVTFRKLLPNQTFKWICVNGQLIKKDNIRCYYAGTITDVDKFYK